MKAPKSVSAAEARLVCNPKWFKFRTTSGLPEIDGLVGQESALAAIDFALGLASRDFHLFATGSPGTGRSSMIPQMAREATRERPIPPDICYVYNFDNPNQPQAVLLEAGAGRVFVQEMRKLVEYFRKNIPAALASRDYRSKYQSTLQDSLDKRRVHFDVLEKAAKKLGIGVEDTMQNIQLMPLNEEGVEMTEEQYNALSDEEKKAIEDKERSLRDDILNYLDHARIIQETTDEQLRELDRATVQRVVAPRIHEVGARLPHKAVRRYLEDVSKNVLDTLESFAAPEPSPSQGQMAEFQEMTAPQRLASERYDVNLVVDNSSTVGGPVISELNPTYTNLVGKVERRVAFGAMETNHMLIRAGAVLRANGGILILDASELLSHPFAYHALRRCLREMLCTIEEPEDAMLGMQTVSLRPDAIDISVQVILIGSIEDYLMLRELDPEFARLVKVRADFVDTLDLTAESANLLARYIGTVCRRRGLLHLTSRAVARVVEFASRLAGRRDEMTLRLEDVTDLLVEASFWAGRNGSKVVDRSHVEIAERERQSRSNVHWIRALREFERGNILLDTSGTRVGQITGLAVFGIGGISFGLPARITAKTFVGSAGLVNIERETELSGEIHSKAVMILSGFLGWKYAQDHPLVLSASITFEQNYSMVEGDSASLAEGLAVLSSLSELPIRQDLAITGSMNQHGEVQPIGGVNEKIEGFFKVCESRGLTGSQGVVIPRQNVADLNLHHDVVNAISRGMFYIYPVESLDDCIRIFLECEPGKQNKSGKYPPESVHSRVAARLAKMAAAALDPKGENPLGKKGKPNLPLH